MLQQALFTLLSFLSIAFASPIHAAGGDGGLRGWSIGGGVVGFIILVLDIIVWVEILQSSRDVLPKVGWCLLVFIFPLVGLIIYALFSNRTAHKRGYEAIP